jgi:hypothetical protein
MNSWLRSTSFSWVGLANSARAYSEELRGRPSSRSCAECERLRYALVQAISTYVIAGMACAAEPRENGEFEKWKAKRSDADSAWDDLRRDLIGHEKTHSPQ